jgi:asparagine synthetase B (glutamine-hydrolysing)
MSGVVGVFALGGSRVPCEPRISEMANVVTKDSDYTVSFSDHRLRLEAIMDPNFDQSSFQCEETGCLTWLLGYFDNKAQLVSRISSEGAEPNNSAELRTRLYQMKGLLAIPMLRGAFVALIWDPSEHRLAMVRDPLGIRNLYFSKDGDHLWFATSPEALALEPPSLDMAALHSLILTGSPGQGRTLAQKLETLKPGELLVAERGQIMRSRYWQFLYEDRHNLD